MSRLYKSLYANTSAQLYSHPKLGIFVFFYLQKINTGFLFKQNGIFVRIFSSGKFDRENMASWTMAEAKKDFDRGLLTGFEIHDSSGIMSNVQHWSVSLNAKIGEGGALTDAREKLPRQFRTMDAVVAALRSIGFRAVILSGR